ncbi:angio-associated migratory cell protein [Maniola jurtina]|uniref:angio-associated migratory cell protein n=1 Tax=Maniola jurtina TaxID=191418 RepID=UPI001E68BCD2|nr:angio-associated migratory cell protein [Maniola jurtina]
MIERQENTPPSSINGDEIVGMDDDGIIFEEMEEVDFTDEIFEEVDDQEEEDEEMEKPEDLAALVFDKHNGSVFCCDLHPNGKLAATGGEDDKAYVWSTEHGQTIMNCTGHKDSVFFVGFSYDGACLATVDMSGVIKVWKCRLDDDHQVPWPIAFEYEADDLSWALWHFGSRVLICGAMTGDIYIFKIPSGEAKVLKGHTIRTECGKIFHDGVRLASGYKDGSLKIWDLKSGTVLQHIPPGTHDIWINAIDVHPENSLLASISTDGKIALITPSNGKVVEQMDTEIDLETIAFSPDPQLGYFAVGALNGSTTIWDTGKKMIRHHCAKADDESSSGVTKIIWIKDQIVAGCLDGSLRVYDAKSGERKFVLTGHCSQVLDLCYNAKENIILSTSNDGTARIFKYTEKSEND